MPDALLRDGIYSIINNLTNGKYTGSYWHGFTVTDKPLTMKISRADIADFMLKQLVDNAYPHEAPSISY